MYVRAHRPRRTAPEPSRTPRPPGTGGARGTGGVSAGRPRRWLLVTIALALVGAGCGPAGGEVERVEREVEVKPTPTPVPTVVHPLTGEGFHEPQDWEDRPAISLKMDNHPSARPQVGLNATDVVYEVLAEGGITRFIAVFHSREVERIGPIRSVRVTDPEVIAPVRGMLGHSGGVPEAVQAVRNSSSLVDAGVDARPGAYSRDRNRQSPHNLFSSTTAHRRSEAGEPPKKLFDFLSEAPDEQGDGEPGERVSIRFSGMSERVQFVYEAGTDDYARFVGGQPHPVEGGGQARADNVLIQRGSRTMGHGEALLLRDGRAHHGTWSRESLTEPATFVDRAGNTLRLKAGRTWVAVVPGAGSVTLGDA